MEQDHDGQPGEQTMDAFLADVERRAFCMARFATGCREDALDIVQDTMISFVQSYAARAPAQWPPLFHRVLQNKIRDFYRRSSVRNRLRVWFGGDEDESDWLQTASDPVSQDPLMQHQNIEALVGVQSAVYGLPARQQQAFLLRNWEGLSVAETAQAMECSEGSVKTHYSRAMKQLRDVLEDPTE